MIKIETVKVNMIQRKLSIISSSGIIKAEFTKKNFGQELMKYLEDYLTKNGFEVINAESPGGSWRYYHLIKKE